MNITALVITIFFIFINNANAANNDSICINKIKNNIYYSNSSDKTIDHLAIKSNDQEVFKKIYEIYQDLPRIQKLVFCHVGRIQIHTSLNSSAYAAYNVTKLDGINKYTSYIGIKKSILLMRDNSDLFSWKEQLSFGLSNPADPYFSSSPKGQRVLIEMDEKIKNPELFYMLIHEINHLLDFMNNANDFECDENYQNCRSNLGSFSDLSFPKKLVLDGEIQHKELNRFKILAKMCFYSCSKFLDTLHVNSLYKELSNSSFITTYASTSFLEDFAEMATAHLLQSLNIKYNLIIYGFDGLIIYNQNRHYFDSNNIEMRIKRKWIQDFFNRRDLKYKWN